MMTWLQLFRDMGIFGLAAFFIQKVIENKSARRLEQYKNTLDQTIRTYQLNLDSALEKYKSELNLHLTRQTSLHEKLLNIIQSLHNLVIELNTAMQDITGMHIIHEDEKKENDVRVKRAQDAYVKFSNFVVENKLFLNKNITTLLEKIRKEYDSANFDFFLPQRLEAITHGKTTPEGYEIAIKKSLEASKKITDDIPKILETLQMEFQKVLGVI